MAEPKPFASLSSGLLARKGAAKPAMRPQGFGQVPMGVGLEDLGWNDMGSVQPVHAPEPLPEHVPSSIAALTPAPRHGSPEYLREQIEEPAEQEIAPPPVVEQQRVIEATFAEPAKPAPAPKAERKASVVQLPTRERRAPGSKAKAAFTLRLDSERHLKLRLACAVTHRSAQQLVTEALDRFLVSLPEVDALSSSVAAKSGKRN